MRNKREINVNMQGLTASIIKDDSGEYIIVPSGTIPDYPQVLYSIEDYEKMFKKTNPYKKGSKKCQKK
jgi:hypothetical protein